MSEYLIIYFCVVIPLGAFLAWWSKRRIHRIERERKKSVSKIKRFEAVATSTPFERPEIGAREAALESVETRYSIIRRLTFITILVAWILAMIFPLLGEIPVAFISILVGAVGVIVGIAARPFVENLISGIVLSFTHPIYIGDTVVIDGNYGTVEDITISHTVIKIWNWRRYVIPNSQMMNKEFVNCSMFDSFQWVHIEIRLSYDTDLDLVKKLAYEAVNSSQYFANYEEPKFWIMDMEDKGYKCWLAAWAKTPSEGWNLANDMRTKLVMKFREHNIKAHKIEVDYPSVATVDEEIDSSTSG